MNHNDTHVDPLQWSDSTRTVMWQQRVMRGKLVGAPGCGAHRRERGGKEEEGREGVQSWAVRKLWVRAPWRKKKTNSAFTSYECCIITSPNLRYSTDCISSIFLHLLHMLCVLTLTTRWHVNESARLWHISVKFSWMAAQGHIILEDVFPEPLHMFAEHLNLFNKAFYPC